MEELEHHGEYAVEVARAGGALEHVAERAGGDGHLAVGRVEVLGLRGEDDVDTLLRTHRQVVGERARVAGEVLTGAELQRVDEDADHDPLGPGAGQPDQ